MSTKDVKMPEAVEIAETSVVVMDDVPLAEKDEKVEEPEKILPPVSILELLKFAEAYDWVLMLCGAIGGIASGVTMPLFSILLGGLYNDFIGVSPVLPEGERYARLFAYVAVGAFVGGFAQMACFTIASERMTLKIRRVYLDAVLKQDISWFDTCKSGELASKIAENTVIIREGLGDKLGNLFQFMSMFVTGFIIGFIYNWTLTLVICAVSPLLAIGGGIMMKIMEEATSKGLGAYASAGGIAEEAIGMIRTVVSFGIENRTAERYKAQLGKAEEIGVKKARAQGLGMGFTFGVYFMCYALAFWYGSVIVENSQNDAASAYPPGTVSGTPSFCTQTLPFSVSPSEIFAYSCTVLSTPTDNVTFTVAADVCNCASCKCGCNDASASCIPAGDITTVFFAVIMGAFALGQASPSITALMNAKAAAATIYSVIDRIPEIISDSDEGLKLDGMKGNITFSNVVFRYPTRQEVPVFSKLNLEIEHGNTVALVGGSGCGKSTIIQLLQRFYDPEEGNVFVDGSHDVRDLNLAWFRSQIGLVGQEPVLFATSIAQNISYGACREVSMEEIERAAKSANAYDFISEFPDGFQTEVGSKGSSLSGGQKQRIAIARALIRNPSILLLDEATSALDNESERIVQKAIDELLGAKSMTTVVVAHRLSTVRNADKIVVLGGGGVLEQGTHDDLLKIENGHYFALVAAANRSQGEDGEEADIESLVDEVEGPIHRLSSNRSRTKSRGVSHMESEKSDIKVEEVDEQVEIVTKGCCGRKVTKKEKKEKPYTVPISRIFTFAKPERWHFIPAVLAAIVNGLVMPLFAILFSGISTVYYEPTQDMMKEQVKKYSLYFVGLGLAVGLAYFLQFNEFGLIGERMTVRIRYALFAAVIRQDVGFFDDRDNSVGALTSKLATDASLVKASLTDRMGVSVMNVTTMISGLIIAFYYGWLLTLVLLGTLPLLLIAAAFQMAAMGGLAKEDESAMAESAQVLSESIAGIRTVTSFNIRPQIVALYTSLLAGPQKLGIKKGITVGSGFGLSQGLMFIIYSIAFVFGSWLIDNKGYDFEQLIRVFFAVVMMGFGMGQSAAMAPDIAKAGNAISNVFKIIDRKSPIDATNPGGLKSDAESSSNIQVKNVSFAYPTRPDVQVLKDFSVTIEKGTTVALVGQSGSGKSTIISLLERYYDPLSGSISIHGIDTKEANVGYLRAKLGLVGQEPELFDTTIAENICYGLPEGQIATQEQIEMAAKTANAHNFISDFPDAYETQVGRGGSSLSGGQKQRIAIARAIIRDPEILLLDEATAALDNESERIVQEALDDLVSMKKRTTIVIAHRLTTIQNADMILAMDHGVLLEAGTHSELLAKEGYYYKLWNAQNKRKE